MSELWRPCLQLLGKLRESQGTPPDTPKGNLSLAP